MPDELQKPATQELARPSFVPVGKTTGTEHIGKDDGVERLVAKRQNRIDVRNRKAQGFGFPQVIQIDVATNTVETVRL